MQTHIALPCPQSVESVVAGVKLSISIHPEHIRKVQFPPGLDPAAGDATGRPRNRSNSITEAQCNL